MSSNILKVSCWVLLFASQIQLGALATENNPLSGEELSKLMVGKWKSAGTVREYLPDGTTFRLGSDETNSKTGYDPDTGETRPTRWRIEGERLIQDKIAARRTQRGMEFLLIPDGFKARIVSLTESQLTLSADDTDEEMTFTRLSGVEPSTQPNSFRGEMFPETRNEYLAESKISDWSVEQIRHAINEMFARHGADFPKADIKKRFSSLEWYKPRQGVDFDDIEAGFSEIEKANLKLLSAARDAKSSKSRGIKQQQSTPSSGPFLVDLKAQTVDGVKMSHTGPALLAKLGPKRVTKTTEFLEGDPHDVFIVSFGNKKAYRHWAWFSVDDPAFRTVEGLGVGSSVAEFEKVYGRGRESHEEGYKILFGGMTDPQFSVEASGRGNYRNFKVTRIAVSVSEDTNSDASSQR